MNAKDMEIQKIHSGYAMVLFGILTLVGIYFLFRGLATFGALIKIMPSLSAEEYRLLRAIDSYSTLGGFLLGGGIAMFCMAAYTYFSANKKK